MMVDSHDSEAVAIAGALPGDPNPLECGRYSGPWFVAAIEWGQEDLARGECLQREIQTFLPLVRRAVQCADGRKRRLIEKAFPGYLFVLLRDAEDWHGLKRCRGVAGVLHAVGDREAPAAVPASEMAQLLRMASAQGVLEELSDPPELPVITPGGRVRITEGWFAGQTGVCEWSATQRVAVLLDLLGLGRVTLERRQVETLDEEVPR